MNNVLESHELSEVDYDPFAQGALAQVVPVTRPQREIWLADRLGDENSLAYNLSMSVRLRGPLDRDALCAAVRELPGRHESLRATIGPEGDVLCIGDSLELDTTFEDLSNLDVAERAAAVAARRKRAVETTFDLEHGPLIRAELLRVTGNEHLLLLTVHHIICDGWSCGVIVQELGMLYARERGDASAELPQIEGFADFALTEASREDSDQYHDDEAWWLSQFPGEVPVLDLPTDRPRPSQRQTASARIDHELDAALVSALRSLGARHGATLFSTMLAGFSTLISRLSGQSTVVIGVPAAGQAAHRHLHLVGHCVNLLPLRFDLDPALPFEAAIDASKTTMLDAMEHQRYTFGTLLSKLRFHRDPSRMPLVSVMFNLDRAIDDHVQFPGLEVELGTNPRSYETFELSVNAVQTRNGLRLECQYNRSLFDGETVDRWLHGFEALLRAAVEAPSTEVGRLPLLGPAQRAELDALQPAPVAFDRDRRMHEHFELQCDRNPSRTALRFGDETCTYAQLDARANRIARLLRSQGVQRGALVGLALERGMDMVAALLGVLKAGAGYVPLDPQFPRERLDYMASDSGLATLLTSSSVVGSFALPGRPVLALDQLDAQLASGGDSRIGRDEGAASPDDIAYVIYTSGSTGRPKGVMVPHRAVANFIAGMQVEPGLDAHDRLLAVTTLSFDIAVLELMLPLSVGAEVVLAGREAAGEGRALAELLSSSGATAMQATPSTWRMLLDAGWTGGAGFKSMCGGEALPADLAAQLLPRCGSLWNLYGPTETTVWSTCARIAPAPDQALPDVHIGRPIANTQVWVLDAGGELCPRGVPGELYIGGEGVTLGYLDRPELTAQRFVPDRFGPQSASQAGAEPRLYRTGDRGRWRADGALEHLGRLDHQVKVRGFRIELGEIEANLAERSDVARAVVIVREDQPNDQRLVAYIVPREGTRIDETELRTQLRSTLPTYMVPQHFVVLAALPLLPNGKLDRNALPRPVAEPASAKAQPGSPQLPADPRVRYLAGIWSELLGVEPGADDNFFDLGGHSMLAVQMVNRVSRETGVSFKLIRLGAETLGQLAADLPADPTSGAAPQQGTGSRIGQGLRRLFGLSAQEPR
ncbi:amino acid adenylation domain-containing protein [Lysobacter korlensis]|uniref:Amino acid adenylation domain-containing protein n=1 Tax=Lysobacter korlensis TaxID=553636 RepID=A0ABV6RQ74_9GAMM